MVNDRPKFLLVWLLPSEIMPHAPGEIMHGDEMSWLLVESARWVCEQGGVKELTGRESLARNEQYGGARVPMVLPRRLFGSAQAVIALQGAPSVPKLPLAALRTIDQLPISGLYARIAATELHHKSTTTRPNNCFRATHSSEVFPNNSTGNL